MSRPLRIEFAGASYHVTSRGNGRKPIFRNDQDRLSFLEVLHKANQRYHWLCHAYCPRYLGRPGLEDLFSGKVVRDRKVRNERVGKAIGEWGYSQREVADYLRLHYSTLSRIMKEREKSTNKT